MIIDVGIVIGSLRQGSVSRKVAAALTKHTPEPLKLSCVEIGGLESYNEDLEQREPASWVALRASVARRDALLFVTPEYNRSLPGILKNALDVGSRPAGKNVWSSKPACVVSLSGGALGGFGAQHHLRQILSGLNVAVMPGPEVYLSKASALFDDAGELISVDTAVFLSAFMTKFRDWARHHYANAPIGLSLA